VTFSGAKNGQKKMSRINSKLIEVIPDMTFKENCHHRPSISQPFLTISGGRGIQASGSGKDCRKKAAR